MSTSCESTSLKKSSGDCLKLAKHVIQHLSEMMLFLNYCIISGVQKHYLGAVGNYSIYWLLTLLVTRMPNIMKIRQCFLELQLKMSGMFFETQCSWEQWYVRPCNVKDRFSIWTDQWPLELKSCLYGYWYSSLHNIVLVSDININWW